MDYKTLLREDGSRRRLTPLTGGRAAKARRRLSAPGRSRRTREQAEALRGLRLYIPRDVLPEPDEDEFYVTDLIGMEVRGLEGDVLGHVKSVRDFGAGDLLEVQPPSGESWWLPFTTDAVPEVRMDDAVLVAAKPDEVE